MPIALQRREIKNRMLLSILFFFLVNTNARFFQSGSTEVRMRSNFTHLLYIVSVKIPDQENNLLLK